ncbi:DUF2382 domain-containing protein [Modestobacter marinus]|uniref:DUF2382 domain-containing protein n=1 Tax=Modestobacter marinus TaxID=477641 RepID=UPI001C94D136|nr:PRC and DUF2382 domain-containing protein [Modestobacter marinus]
MIGTDTLDRVIGADVYDADGDKIGTASEVYLDDQSGNPEWVTVKTGLFGTKQSFVPIRDADLTGDGLRVPVSKAQVKDAPKIDTDGHLSPDEEQELYRYYGMGSGGTDTITSGQAGTAGTAGTAGLAGTRETEGAPTGRSTDTDFTRAGAAQTSANTGMGAGMTDPVGDTQATTNAGYDDTTSTTGTAGLGTSGSGTTTAGTAGADLDDRNRHGTRGHDTSGPTTDDAMTLSEERVNVGTEQVEAGRARLRKYVVTENVTRTVPVSHEEVRVEREPITEANIGNATDGPAISEEEHEVTLTAERPVVEKEAVPVERVRLDTDTVTEQQQVSETVRKEHVDTDGVRGDATTRDDRSLKDKAKDVLDRDRDGRR